MPILNSYEEGKKFLLKLQKYETLYHKSGENGTLLHKYALNRSFDKKKYAL